MSALDNFFGFFARQSTTGMVFIIAISWGGYYSMVYNDGSALQAQISKAKSELDKEKVKEKESDAALQERQLISAHIDELNATFQAASQQLPQEISMADMLKAVDTISMSSGVHIVKTDPRPSSRQNFLELYPIKISAEGRFSEIAMFIYYVTSLERITKISSFDITPIKEKNQAKDDFNGTGRLRFEADIVSYKYVGEPEDNKKAGGKRK